MISRENRKEWTNVRRHNQVLANKDASPFLCCLAVVVVIVMVVVVVVFKHQLLAKLKNASQMDRRTNRPTNGQTLI